MYDLRAVIAALDAGLLLEASRLIARANRSSWPSASKWKCWRPCRRSSLAASAACSPPPAASSPSSSASWSWPRAWPTPPFSPCSTSTWTAPRCAPAGPAPCATPSAARWPPSRRTRGRRARDLRCARRASRRLPAGRGAQRVRGALPGWRFHHVKLVERVIGDRSPGTAGSAGSGYLGKTLHLSLLPRALGGAQSADRPRRPDALSGRQGAASAPLAAPACALSPRSGAGVGVLKPDGTVVAVFVGSGVPPVGPIVFVGDGLTVPLGTAVVLGTALVLGCGVPAPGVSVGA